MIKKREERIGRSRRGDTGNVVEDSERDTSDKRKEGDDSVSEKGYKENERDGREKEVDRDGKKQVPGAKREERGNKGK